MENDLVNLRAKYAFNCVKEWTQEKQAVQLVKGLPVMIRTLGLAQGIAMIARKSDAASQELSYNICGWLLEKSPYRPLGEARSSAVELIQRIMESGYEEVSAAEEEAIRFAEVLKLFGELIHGNE